MLASAAIGANSIAFEPVPSTYARLMENIRANHMQERVTVYNLAVADQAGSLAFTYEVYSKN